MADIEALLRAGSIDTARARLLFEMHRNAARGVLLTTEGIGVTTADDLVAAAPSVVTGGVARMLRLELRWADL